MKNLLLVLKPKLQSYFFFRHLKPTLRFVALVATPLCLVNSFIASQDSVNFFADWATRFTYSFLITFPQAVVYVSLIKWFDSRR
ncbi:MULTISPECIES: hypothetical protein [Pontibacter]|uniref:DUF2798 domain-containing protein n=1 Tax=Pontibacter lucknowensis TaxID=1077936 RepID=A0A1N6ZIW3_9BACT|nr:MULTISPECIES: hypothetical protein [Pontibacter]EJF10452.1 hypothetical protein O71_09139 [Pontibacter sp. BAB1700]SIR26759.1 hypothetical protein SAMN05421545_3017 [Pontibacter lucknowensis]